MHKFSPAKADNLELSERHDFLQPERTLRDFGLREGMKVLDIGTGTGFFARAAARIVGKSGTVYACDISSEMLESFRRFGVPENVRLSKSGEREIHLPAGLVDFTLFAFVLHESTDIPGFLAEAARITKPGGRIAVVEWKKQSEENGPPEGERLSRDELLSKIDGFKVIAAGGLNPSHYFCILKAEGEEIRSE
jgi:ubiquinone/menaquinone biosynthesis C-methylase UbiE